MRHARTLVLGALIACGGEAAIRRLLSHHRRRPSKRRWSSRRPPLRAAPPAATLARLPPRSAIINTSNVISATRNPANDIVTCIVPISTIAMLPPAPVPAGMRAGIRTRSMNASFEWLMIFETR